MRAMRYQPQGRLRFNTCTTLLRDLAHSWAIGTGGPRVLLDATGRAHGVLNTGNFKRGGPQGLYIGIDDAGTGSVNTVAVAVGDASGSGAPKSNVFAFAFRVLLPSTRGSVHSDNSALFGGPSGGIEIRQRSDGRIEVLRQQTAIVATSPTAYPFDRDCDVGISYDDATFRFYLDGRPFGAVTNAGIRFQQTGQYWLGAGPGTASAFERLRNGSRIHCADVWSRALSDAEFQQWSANPWRLYAAPDSEDVAAPAGGPQSYTYAAAGGFVLTGVAGAVRGTLRQPVGGPQLGGGAVASRAVTRAAVGGISLQGAASQARTRGITGAGGMLLGGLATIATTSTKQLRTVIAAGGIAFAGVVQRIASTARTAVGGLNVGGAAGYTNSGVIARAAAILRRRARPRQPVSRR